MDGWSEVDSRDYILPLEILNIRDVPADFCLPAEWTRFEAGLFLPRDRPDWFGRSAYPARILLLSRDKLFALPHPSTREGPAVCGLKEISFVESGQMLLRGWMSFRASKFDCTTPYNRCGYRPVCRFMRRFRVAWLPDRSVRTEPPIEFGDTLDCKFKYALAEELDPAERSVAGFFQAPREVRVKKFCFSQLRWDAGDLIALTPRRVLWITDRDSSGYARYGTIARSAPISAVRSIQLISVTEPPSLEVAFEAGPSWIVPLRAENLESVGEFVRMAYIGV